MANKLECPPSIGLLFLLAYAYGWIIVKILTLSLLNCSDEFAKFKGISFWEQVKPTSPSAHRHPTIEQIKPQKLGMKQFYGKYSNCQITL
jgi:hypothetical protein